MDIVFFFLFMFFHCISSCNGESVVGTTKNFVSVCIGDPVTLNVQTYEDESNSITMWEFEETFTNYRANYSLTRNGRTLKIKEALPFHSGIYIALVKSKTKTRKITFKVSVEDIYLRAIPSLVRIPLGENRELKAKRTSGKGLLLWFFRGERIHQGTQTSHYWFQKSTSGDEEKLMLIGVKEEQQGLYEVVLKSGSCEVRNVIEVKLKEEKSTSGLESQQSRMTIVIVVTALLPSLALVIGAVAFLYLRKRRKKQKMKQIVQMLMKKNFFEEGLYGQTINQVDIYGQATKLSSLHSQTIERPDIYGQAIKQKDIYGQVYMDMSALQHQPSEYSLESEDMSFDSEAGSESDNRMQEVAVDHQGTSGEAAMYQESPYSTGQVEQLYYQRDPYLYSNPSVSAESNVLTTNTMAPVSDSAQYASRPGTVPPRR